MTSPLQASKPDHRPRQGSAPGRGRPGDRACGHPTPRSRGGGFPSSPSHTLQTQRQLLYTNPLPPPPQATVLLLSQVLLAPPSRSQCQGLEGLTDHAHCKGTEAAPMGTLPHTSSCAHSLQGPGCPLPTVGSWELRWAEGPGRCRKDQEGGLALAPRARGVEPPPAPPGRVGVHRAIRPTGRQWQRLLLQNRGTPRWLWLEAPAEPQHAIRRLRQRAQTGGRGCARSQDPGSTDGNQCSRE